MLARLAQERVSRLDPITFPNLYLSILNDVGDIGIEKLLLEHLL